MSKSNLEKMLQSIIRRLDRIEAKLDGGKFAHADPKIHREKIERLTPEPEIRQEKPAPQPRGPNKVSSEHINSVEATGRHYFKRDILDRLEAYFELIKAMKSVDPDAYDLYSSMGAPIVGKKVMFHNTSELPASWRHGTIPAFGAVAVLLEALREGVKDDGVAPDFVYWKRMSAWRSMIEAVRHDETAIEVTFLFSPKDDDDKLIFPLTFNVGVHKETNLIRILRQNLDDSQRIDPKTGSNRRAYVIPIRRWGIPAHVKDWWERNGASAGKRGATNIHSYIAHILCMAAYANENARLDVQINVRKNDLAAIFCIDMLRTPYFFADRDVTHKGQKIFHIVRTHKRVGAGGNETFVKSHFRGIRKFMWNGYNVHITLAGKHHADMLGADFGSYEEGMLNDDANTLTAKEVGEMITESYQ
jgi:hypothetical protein